MSKIDGKLLGKAASSFSKDEAWEKSENVLFAVITRTKP